MEINTSLVNNDIALSDPVYKEGHLDLRWNCRKDSNSVLVFVVFGRCLHEGMDINELLKNKDLPPEGSWSDRSDDCMAYHAPCSQWAPNSGVTLDNREIPRPSLILVFHLQEDNVVLCQDDGRNRIILSRSIQYALKKCLGWPFARRVKYLVNIGGGTADIMGDDVLIWKNGASSFNLPAKAAKETIEIMAGRRFSPEIRVRDEVKAYYRIKREEER